ncbi:MAG: hypothetical protein QW100_00080 [Thermoplasmatales archaeon]
MRKRSINTLPYLAVDALVLLYYAYNHSIIAIFAVPVMAEYFVKKYIYIPYLLVLVPPFISPSFVTVSLAYSIVLIRFFKFLMKDFGTGDVKVLQTIAMVFPYYINIPLRYSLFPPVLSVMLVASAIGLVGSVIATRIGSHKSSPDPAKFWIRGGKIKYKIPFVAYVCASYTSLIILSLLQWA